MSAVIKPADAGAHARNTLVDGLIASVLVGVITGVMDVLDKGHFTWQTAAVSIGTAAATSAFQYLRHAYLAPYVNIRKQNRKR